MFPADITNKDNDIKYLDDFIEPFNIDDIITQKVFKGNQKEPKDNKGNICVFRFKNLHNYSIFQKTLYNINVKYKEYCDHYDTY